MKKNLSSIVFAVIVFLVGGYSFYEFQYKEQQNPNDLNKVKLFSFTPDQVMKLTVKRLDKAPLIIEKKESGWMVTSEFEDLGDVPQIAAFLTAITSEKAKIAKKEGDIPWKDYQLDQPAFSLEIEGEKGKKESVAVSSMPAFDGSYFIQSNNQLLVGEKSWGQHLTKTAESLRDKKVFRDPFEPNKIIVTYEDKGLKEKFQIEKSGVSDASQTDQQNMAAQWKIVGKNMELYDAKKIDDMIRQIQSLRTNDFLPEPATPEDVKRYGLDRVTSRVEWAGPDNKSWWISFGTEDKSSVLARSSSVKGVLAFSPSLVDKIRVPLASLRNGQLPFQYDLEKVKRVKISTGKSKSDLKKSDLTWVLAKEDEAKEIDQAQLADFFQKAQNLNAIQFLAQDPARVKYIGTLQLLDAADKEVLSLRFSGETQLGQQNVVYARSNKSGETLVLLASEVAKLPLETLVKDKALPAQPGANSNGGGTSSESANPSQNPNSEPKDQ